MFGVRLQSRAELPCYTQLSAVLWQDVARLALRGLHLAAALSKGIRLHRLRLGLRIAVPYRNALECLQRLFNILCVSIRLPVFSSVLGISWHLSLALWHQSLESASSKHFSLTFVALFTAKRRRSRCSWCCARLCMSSST